MNSNNRTKRHKGIKAYESRAPGQSAANTVRIATRRQESCKERTEINHYSEESVKKFNLLLNKKHNLVDTTPDKPKIGFVRDSRCRTFPFGGIEE